MRTKLTDNGFNVDSTSYDLSTVEFIRDETIFLMKDLRTACYLVAGFYIQVRPTNISHKTVTIKVSHRDLMFVGNGIFNFQDRYKLRVIGALKGSGKGSIRVDLEFINESVP